MSINVFKKHPSKKDTREYLRNYRHKRDGAVATIKREFQVSTSESVVVAFVVFEN